MNRLLRRGGACTPSIIFFTASYREQNYIKTSFSEFRISPPFWRYVRLSHPPACDGLRAVPRRQLTRDAEHIHILLLVQQLTQNATLP